MDSNYYHSEQLLSKYFYHLTLITPHHSQPNAIAPTGLGKTEMRSHLFSSPKRSTLTSPTSLYTLYP
ncbi:MAG: hypothetical protein HWQ23_26590 [Nostoc sp. JL33]|uniref:hypothetical protein n=1 Tax=Nostoc sp. JL33 TaxID=2815396 RepID=UPI0025F1E1A7|nr:hypothetical protein [Nostoc sp. JL33]MBN3873705.1 hypothetical protein [Nostoc sp. JL33]